MSQGYNQDKLVASVRQATADVFGTMLDLAVEEEPAYVESVAAEISEGVVSLIGLAGDWVGTGSIACGSQLACVFSSKLLMSEYDQVNEDVMDAVAEITNMIVGNVKTAIEEDLGPMGLSIPTVVFGHEFKTRSVGQAQWVVVPFRSGTERFLVRICLVPGSSGKGHHSVHGHAALPAG